MTMRMLIDARHPEETRVAVVQGNRIEEFDFESAEHKQLKGNIYLAKVIRGEPSLQAVFVDYGGNRHGFLAFSEIHPDYYQIPKSDRDALLAEEAEHAAEEERLRAAAYDAAEAAGELEESDEDADERLADEADEEPEAELDADADESAPGDNGSEDQPRRRGRRSSANEAAADELRRKRQDLRRRYKIQDVIQRRQVLLVQVVKEERGNKGAALTTYLSLAGRYCVLMPNTSHGGGISRKISNGADRKRLKTIMAELKLPSTMGLIVRTAGLQRTKTEIKRDFDYLARLWDEVRENTLKSSAPALIYRDSDLVKRAIRDLYHREIDEVMVEGEEGFKAARGYMKLLMPSHVRRVQLHAETTPLFQRQGVEDQLNAMYQPVVQLKSGGYLVINPTEALVSIDINSGRSTREHNIEQTAYATNLEAAQEIARQLRLRDMAGLVVIDFIDMEQSGHVRKVEKAMKEALKNDRARIQVGRISSFGLMEMSRQRLRTGVLEASTKACPHCEGTGLMRTASSAGLSALRMLEDEAARGRGEKVCLRAGREAAIYVLNKKRSELADLEARYGVVVEVLLDESFEGARMSVESSGPRPVAPVRAALPAPAIDDEPEVDEFEDLEDFEEEDEAEEQAVRGDRAELAERGEGEDDRNGRRRRRRRRGGRGRNRREEGDVGGEPASEDVEHQDEAALDSGEVVDTDAEPAEARSEHAAEDDNRRPRRGRRGGRRRRGEREASEGGEPLPEREEGHPPANPPTPDDAPMKEPVPSEDPSPDVLEPAPVASEDEKPKARRRPRSRKAASETAEAQSEPAIEAQPLAEAALDAPADAGAIEAEAPAKPKRRSRAKKPAAAEQAPSPVLREAEPASEQAAQPETPVEAQQAAESVESGPEASNDTDGDANGNPRRGWWQRTFG